MNTNLQAANHQPGLDQGDPDRRFRLEALPTTVMNSLRWLGRPQMPEGNPAYSYMVETPQGDFAVMIGHYVNGEVHPFEVWINGAEAPRGLGAIAKTLSADMRTYDRAWVSLKLDSLVLCDGYPCEVELPPDGDKVRVPGVVSAFARVVQYHVKKIGWLDGEGDNSLVNAMMFRKEPKTGTEGTLSKTFDVKNPSTGEDFAMFIKELELPDGTCRPYSVWLSGAYPKDLDGLCKLLSIDMRIADIAWIGMKLRKLLNYREPLGSFIGKAPGTKAQEKYPSTIAYVARLLLYRYYQLNLLNMDGSVKSSSPQMKVVS